MSSTLDSAVKQINTDLKLSTSKAVHSVINDVLKGRQIDPAIVTGVVNNVMNKAIGNILNHATQSVNKTISNALGKKLKNSPLNVIAANYVSDVLTSVITGRQTPGITVKMTNAISESISRELYSKLPSGITRNFKIDVLGTKFSVGLTSIVGKAVNDTVKAVVGSVFSNTSSASKVSIPGINAIPSLTSLSIPALPNLSSLPTNLGGLTASIAGLSDTLGSYTNNVVSSLSNLGDLNLTSLEMPAGLDLGRVSSSNGLGKMIQLASTSIGNATNLSGMSKSDFGLLQKQLADSNINNPLKNIGGVFDGIDSIISGASTSSGVRSITKDITSKLFDINTSFGVLSDADKTMLNNIDTQTTDICKNVAKQAVTEAASFKTLSEDQLNKLTAIKQGFQDPNAKYPLPEYANRTEVNKLATGDVDNTIVDKKNAERMVGAQLPNGGSWDQPVSSYNSKYPYNHVTETESGHVIEMDDTPGAERIHVFHKSGSSVEIDPVGNRIQIIKGSDYTIIDSNGYISIQGKANVSINGACNIFIGSDANIEVNGNTTVNCHNNIEMNAAGRLKLTAGEGIDIKSPEIFMDADNQFQLNADISAKMHVKEFNIIVDTDMKTEVHNDYRLSVSNNNDVNVGGITKHHSKGDYHVNTEGNIFQSSNDNHVDAKGTLYRTGNVYNLSSAGDVNFTASGIMNNKASKILERCSGWAMNTGSGVMTASGGNLSFNTGGQVAIDASMIYLNSGHSSSTGEEPTEADQSQPAQVATTADALETEYSDTNYITGRKSISETIIQDKFVKQYTASKVCSHVISSITSENNNINDESKATLIEDHDISPDAIDKKPIIMEQANIQVQDVTTILPDEIPLGDSIVPDNFKLSPHFTIESLTTKATESHSLEIVGDALPLSKVVANLQYIALNVLEPIYAARPDMIVYSGFKPITENQTTLDRSNYGLVVSLDFKDANTFDDYFDIAKIIAQIIPYDEMTLVYLSKDFTGTHTDTATIVIKVPGVFYPNVTDVDSAGTLQKWVNANNKKKLRTWFNSKLVDDSNLVRLS